MQVCTRANATVLESGQYLDECVTLVMLVRSVSGGVMNAGCCAGYAEVTCRSSTTQQIKHGSSSQYSYILIAVTTQRHKNTALYI